jgi:hypothetical protein
MSSRSSLVEAPERPGDLTESDEVFCQMMSIHPRRAEPWPNAGSRLGAFLGVLTSSDQGHEQRRLSRENVLEPRPTRDQGVPEPRPTHDERELIPTGLLQMDIQGFADTKYCVFVNTLLGSL